MRPPTRNIITQGQHGSTKAVDYSAKPDPTVSAPEDMSWDSYQQRGVGKLNAGNCLRMNGKNGLQQFAHLERILIAPGQSVKKGQPIAIMGYTGYTIPSGSGGRHLHWWIKKQNGVYVYPPSLITEKFGGNPTPPVSSNMPKVGNVVMNSNNRTVFARNSDRVLGTIKAPMAHICRGIDSKHPNRFYLTSGQFGECSMAANYSNGKRVEGCTW